MVIEGIQAKIGDIVKILTVEEYRERGGECTDHCALSFLGGLLCEIKWISENACGIAPLPDQERDIENPVSDYHWFEEYLTWPTSGYEPEFSSAFDEVF